MLSVPNNPNHLARWMELFHKRRLSEHGIESVVYRRKVRTEIMIAGRCYSSMSTLTLPRVRFLEGEG